MLSPLHLLLIAGAAALLLGAAVTLAAAWLLAGQIIRRRSPDPPDPPERYGLTSTPVTIAARDGLRIAGRLIGRGERPVVIFCPGINGSMDGDSHLLPAFDAAGLDVLQIDWRAHGESEGECCTLGVREVADVLGALDFLAARGVSRAGLMGFSMGGAVALRTAAQDQRAACVVCDGGFVDPRHAIEGALRERTGRPLRLVARLALWLAGLRCGVKLLEASPLPHASAISPRPVLFIHGDADPFVPIPAQDALFAACGEPKTLWRVPGAGHREAHRLAPEAYRERITAFFREHLS
ncbi:MAG: hypothetical protein Kow00124_30610 [Anaerolineae bacterium]